MRTLIAFLVLLTTLLGGFNQSWGAEKPSVKELLLKLESQLIEGAPKVEVEKTVGELKKAKEAYPVNYIPELNYLLEREVEAVPSSEISFIKRSVFVSEPLKRALETLTFLLLFYTLILGFQHADLSPGKRKSFTLLSVLLLATSVVLNLWPLFFVIAGVGTILALIVNKKTTALILFLGSNLLIFLMGLTANFTKLVESPQFLYQIKVTRDGYSPEHLINKTFSGAEAKVELVTSDLALGDFSRVPLLKEVKTEDPLLKGIILNDLGYFYFMKGDLQKALKSFEEARKFVDSPVILFNLYLTYSSLLKVEEAHRIKEELLKKKVKLPKVLSIPLLLHVPPKGEPAEIPLQLIGAFAIGIVTAFVLDKLVNFRIETINREILLIPGMASFLNSKAKPFILAFLFAFVVNYLLGRAVCSM